MNNMMKRKIGKHTGALVSLTVLLLLLLTAPVAYASFGANVRVDDDTGTAITHDPSLAVDSAGNIYVAWSDYRNDNYDIYSSKSTDGGATWSTNVRVDDDTSTAAAINPSVAVDSAGNIYIAWRDSRNDSLYIYYSKSTDGGATWSANVRVDDNTATAGTYLPSLAVDSAGNIYVAWSDVRNGNYDIYSSQSTDGGATWSANVRVDDDTGTTSAQDPSVAVDSAGNIYVAWNDYRNGNHDIYYSKSTDGGATWSTNVRVDDDTGTADAIKPSVAVDSAGNIYVAWYNYRNYNYDIYSSQSTDGGATWSANVRVDDDTSTADAIKPSVAVDSAGNIYVAWSDVRNGNHDIYSSKSTDGGTTWSTNVRVDDDTGTTSAHDPSLAVDSAGNIYVAWNDYRNDFDIYFAADLQVYVLRCFFCRLFIDCGWAWLPKQELCREGYPYDPPWFWFVPIHPIDLGLIVIIALIGIGSFMAIRRRPDLPPRNRSGF